MFVFTSDLKRNVVLCWVLQVITAFQINNAYRPFEKIMFCRDNFAHNKLYPDEFTYTCKPGPGRFVKCSNICKLICTYILRSLPIQLCMFKQKRLKR